MIRQWNKWDIGQETSLSCLFVFISFEDTVLRWATTTRGPKVFLVGFPANPLFSSCKKPLFSRRLPLDHAASPTSFMFPMSTNISIGKFLHTTVFKPGPNGSSDWWCSELKHAWLYDKLKPQHYQEVQEYVAHLEFKLEFYYIPTTFQRRKSIKRC